MIKFLKIDVFNNFNKYEITSPNGDTSMGSYILSEEFIEKASKVGKDSEFTYRSKFDPAPSSSLKGNEEREDDR